MNPEICFCRNDDVLYELIVAELGFCNEFEIIIPVLHHVEMRLHYPLDILVESLKT